MYVKIIGCIMIVAATTGYGQLLSRDYQKHMDALQYLKQIIQMLRGEIQYTKVPLQEAFRHIGIRLREPYSTWLKELADGLEWRMGASFLQLWESSIETHLIDTKLQLTDLEQLKKLGQNMGYLDEKMQLATIDLYIQQLEHEIEHTREGLTTKKRLCRCLGIMSGIFIAVVLI
ncbi:MAG: stage III sporulation protein AB [Lachnospiraceae bacterium]